MSDAAAPPALPGMPCPHCKVDLVMTDRQGIEIDWGQGYQTGHQGGQGGGHGGGHRGGGGGHNSFLGRLFG